MVRIVPFLNQATEHANNSNNNGKKFHRFNVSEQRWRLLVITSITIHKEMNIA